MLQCDAASHRSLQKRFGSSLFPSQVGADKLSTFEQQMGLQDVGCGLPAWLALPGTVQNVVWRNGRELKIESWRSEQPKRSERNLPRETLRTIFSVVDTRIAVLVSTA